MKTIPRQLILVATFGVAGTNAYDSRSMSSATSISPRPPKDMRLECNIIIVGANGNVGQGILDAASKRVSNPSGRQWSVVAVDPAFEDGNESSDQYQIYPSTLEDISEDTFDGWFDQAQHTEFVYAAEDGNRDNYASNPKLGQENDDRFEAFVKRVAACTQTKQHTRTHISYIGGSWTRRQAIDGIVSDSSPTKPGGGSNPYEIAKTRAESNACRLSTDLGVGITFFDMISVTPNCAPNFSVNQMASSAIDTGTIRYSPGDYGRPLLHTNQAGDMVVSLIERRIADSFPCTTGRYDVVLIPGHFVLFRDFALIAKEVVEKSGKRQDNILEEQMGETPAVLKTRCESRRLKDIGVVPNGKMAIDGLRQSAEAALESLAN